MKRILTLVLCWLIAFTAMAETTFKVKTAASIAGGYVTSLNKVDGSFEDGTAGWVLNAGTIVKTASSGSFRMQGENHGVWSGTGPGRLDLQWTATASNTYEASIIVGSNAEDDMFICAYVGTAETGCKQLPILTKHTKLSVIADSIIGSAFYLRLKHTGSDAFNIALDDGKIEPWTPQSVNLSESIYATYTTLSSTTIASGTALRFTTNISDSHNAYAVGTGIYKAPKSALYSVSVSSGARTDTAATVKYAAYINGTTSGVTFLTTTEAGSYNFLSGETSLWLNQGQELTIVPNASTTINSTDATISITATAISDNVVQTWQPSGSLGELKFLPQNIAPQGFIPALGSSIGKTAGTYQGDAYYDLYKVLWTQSSVTAGEPYVISSAKGSDAATDWAANKTITIDVSGLVVRAYKSGTTAAVGAKQADAFQGHAHTANTIRLGSSLASGTSYDNVGTQTTSSIVTDGTNGTPRTSFETRMTNIAQYAFIRYGNDAPTLYALPTRSEVFSANISASGVATNATQNFVTSCTNAAPSVCSLWSSFGVAPICWTHTLDITKRAEVTASTATTTTVARTDTSTAFNLFCHLK